MTSSAKPSRANAFENEAIWNYKRPKIREQVENLKKIASCRYIYVNGNVMTWEEFGNYHYGYVGKPDQRE